MLWRDDPMRNTESQGITIDRADDRLTISVRTHRSGDFMHYAFGTIAVLFGAVVLWIGVSNGTLFASWMTLPVVLVCLSYGWFAFTRMVNRRVLTVDSGTLSIGDRPVFSLAPSVEVPVVAVGKITVRKERRWIPPVMWYQVSHVEAAGVPEPLFRNLTFEEDATRIKAALVSFLGRR